MPKNVTGGDPGRWNTVALFLTGSGRKDVNGKWADVAILNLIDPGIPEEYAWTAAVVTPATPSSGLTIQKNVSWEVGTGNENGTANPNACMSWKPIKIASTDDSGGYLQTEVSIAEKGDSGGPLFELSPGPPEGGLGHLIVVGILSASSVGFAGLFPSDKYTSLGYSTTNSWIQTEIGATDDLKVGHVSACLRDRTRCAEPWRSHGYGLAHGMLPHFQPEDRRAGTAL